MIQLKRGLQHGRGFDSHPEPVNFIESLRGLGYRQKTPSVPLFALCPTFANGPDKLICGFGFGPAVSLPQELFGDLFRNLVGQPVVCKGLMVIRICWYGVC